MLVAATEPPLNRLGPFSEIYCSGPGGGFITNATLVFPEADVDPPMQAVCDGAAPTGGIFQGLVVCFSTVRKATESSRSPRLSQILLSRFEFCHPGSNRLDPNGGLEPRPPRKGLKHGLKHGLKRGTEAQQRPRRRTPCDGRSCRGSRPIHRFEVKTRLPAHIRPIRSIGRHKNVFENKTLALPLLFSHGRPLQNPTDL